MGVLYNLALAGVIATALLWLKNTLSTAPLYTSPEPPCAPGCLPLIGHLSGLSRGGFEYYVQVREAFKAPIFTIYLLWKKMYIVTDPSYIPAIEKQHRVLSFAPIEAWSGVKLLATSNESKRMLMEDHMSDHGLNADGRDAIMIAMRPGPAVDEMNQIAMDKLALSFNDLQSTIGSGKQIGLFAWAREVLTFATTFALFGPHNPFLDPAVGDAFWEFEKGIIGLLISPFPSITHRAAYNARERCTQGFVPYIRDKHYLQGSQMIRNRIKGHKKNGIDDIRDLARFEIGPCLAALGNTPQAIYWTLLHIYSDPLLLAEIRTEVESITQVRQHNTRKTINITTLKQECPVLLSAYQETLRYHTMGNSVRQVVEDTELNGWRLEKGALLQMPSRVFHMDDANYPNATKFDPRRFVPQPDSKGSTITPGKSSIDREVYFRSWGGGKTMCPGRNFASNEVLAMVAFFVSRFDMKPATGGDWHFPTTKKTNQAVFVMQPDYDPAVTITTRGEAAGAEWELEMQAKEPNQ